MDHPGISSGSVEEYAEQLTSQEDELLYDLYRQTNLTTSHPQMLTGRVVGTLLEMFSRMIAPRRILEIGTFTGYSAIRVARGLKPGGELVTIEREPERTAFAANYIKRAGLERVVTLLTGPAVELLKELQPPFDLVFIDADKAEYPDYYRLIKPLLAPDGWMIADNVLWGGKVVDPAICDRETEGIRRFNKIVAEDPDTEQVLLPVRDGLMIIRMKSRRK